MKVKFVRKEQDNEEQEEWLLNGIELIETNHDTHGWAGMDVVEKLIEDIAQILGGTVEIK